MTSPTYILMHKTQDKPASAGNALKFFDWAYANGDKMADDLDYVPLPAGVKDLVRKQWADNIKDAAGKADRLQVTGPQRCGAPCRGCRNA